MKRFRVLGVLGVMLGSTTLGCAEGLDVGGTGGGFGGGRAGVGGTLGMDAGHMPHPWRSPLHPMGAPGWRSSQSTLCGWTDTIDATQVDVWSDARGVFALVSGGALVREIDAGDDAAGDCRSGCVGLNVHHNDGSGWTLRSAGSIAAQAIDRPRLTGAVDGPLFVHQANTPYGGCALYTVSDRSTACIANIPTSPPFVVDAMRALTIRRDGTLMTFDGQAWAEAQHIVPTDAHTLWADATDVFVAGPAALNRLTPSGWEQELLPFAAVSAMWGGARNDRWLGTTLGEVWHFDGAGWQQVTTLGGVTCDAVDAVRGIWGTGDSVYFYGARSLQRWDGARVADLANWSCGGGNAAITLEAVWGSASDEVFLALRDIGTASACDKVAIIHFDGTQFHRM